MTPRTAYPVCDFSYKRCCRNLMTKTHSQFARLCKARGNASTGSLPTQPLPAGYAACQPPEQAAPTPAEYGQPRASWEGGEESSCAQRSKDNETGFSYPASKILSWWLRLRCLQWSWKYQKDGSEKSCLSSEAAQPNGSGARRMLLLSVVGPRSAAAGSSPQQPQLLRCHPNHRGTVHVQLQMCVLVPQPCQADRSGCKACGLYRGSQLGLLRKEGTAAEAESRAKMKKTETISVKYKALHVSSTILVFFFLMKSVFYWICEYTWTVASATIPSWRKEWVFYFKVPWQ